MTLKLNKIKIRKDIEGYLVYYPERKGLFLINQIGYDILSLCDGINSPDKIIDIISKKYDTDRKIIEKDVLEFIEKSQKMKLII